MVTEHAFILANEGMSPSAIRQRLEEEGYSRVEAYKASELVAQVNRARRRAPYQLIGYIAILLLVFGYGVWLVLSGDPEGYRYLLTLAIPTVLMTVATFLVRLWVKRKAIKRNAGQVEGV